MFKIKALIAGEGCHGSLSPGSWGPDYTALCDPCRLPLQQEPTCAHLQWPLQGCQQPDPPQGFTPGADASLFSSSQSQADSLVLVSCAKIHWLLCWFICSPHLLISERGWPTFPRPPSGGPP